MTLYMMTTQDKYELPLAVAESVGELARLVGAKPTTISNALCHTRHYPKKRRYNRQKWHKIVIEEDEE